jgi:hypothetical protein
MPGGDGVMQKALCFMGRFPCLANHFEHARTVPITGPFFKSKFLVKVNGFFGTDQFKTILYLLVEHT